jgi:hypothetical protein
LRHLRNRAARFVMQFLRRRSSREWNQWRRKRKSWHAESNLQHHGYSVLRRGVTQPAGQLDGTVSGQTKTQPVKPQIHVSKILKPFHCWKGL